MKKLYICGDSFGCKDSEYQIIPWHQLLTDKLKESWTVTNLSLICASNLHIRMQIDRAIENQADYVIVLFTSSVRGQGRLNDQVSNTNLLDSFYRVENIDNLDKYLGCWSYHSLDTNSGMQYDKKQILKNFFTEIFDLNLSIYENQCIIESALYKLKSKQMPFLFDQGGFENPMFGGNKLYFNEFNNHRSKLNLWNLHGLPMVYRPYFHIKDQSIHNDVAEYYYEKITCPD